MDMQLKDRYVESPQPTVSSMRGLRVVRQQREKGGELHDQEPFPDDAYRRWATETRAKINEIFGKDSDYQDLLDVEVDTSTETWGPTARQRARLGQQLEQLDRLMELLETEVAFVTAGTAASEGSGASLDIILVHGYDPTYQETVVHFLKAYGLTVRTVPTQPDAPTSVINAFVEYTDIRFAIVLVTAEETSEPRRPRSDAVLDLGFLLGRLGRTRVCALTAAGVTVPGVDAGILCIPVDDDAEWRDRLVAELQAAGAMDTMDTR